MRGPKGSLIFAPAVPLWQNSSRMSETADAVIIGGGIVGSSVAWHLTEAGCRNVIVIERESQQGLGSTGKSMGGVRAQFATAVNISMSREQATRTAGFFGSPTIRVDGVDIEPASRSVRVILKIAARRRATCKTGTDIVSFMPPFADGHNQPRGNAQGRGSRRMGSARGVGRRSTASLRERPSWFDGESSGSGKGREAPPKRKGRPMA
jgi:choline dehydrogenase-like flavoprotein